MKYRPEIDGLRTIAVLPVILFHAGFSVFSGGYVGVDVFFVISGYLITTILIDEREKGTYSLLGFYERRARRILPALFFVLLCTIPFAWRWIPPEPFEDYARSLQYAAMFISNVHFLEKSSYFDVGAELRPLLHTWSLAVEEQYYLLFPLVLWALGAFVRRKFLLAFLILSAFSLGLAEWGWRNYPTENFFFSPSRLWELLAGSICAAFLFARPLVRNNALALAGLVLVLGSAVFYDESVPFPSVYTVIPVAGTVLIILFAAPGTLVARLLSLKPMVGIGLISYSAYLWHQPLFVFARIRSIEEPSLVLMSLLAVASLVLAYLTWKFIEAPFRARQVLPTQRKVLGTSLAGIVAFAAFGFWGEESDGFSQRVDNKNSGLIAALREQSAEWRDNATCKLGADRQQEGICPVFVPEDPTGTIAVVGDSHAQSLLPAFRPVSEAHNLTVLRGIKAACPPLLGVYLAYGGQDAEQCFEVVQRIAQQVVESDVETVYIIARWSLYASGDYSGEINRFMVSEIPDNRFQDRKTWRKSYEMGVRRMVEHYRNAGIRVVLVEQVPQQWIIPENILVAALLQNLSEEDLMARIDKSFVDQARHKDLVAYSEDVLAEVAADTGAELLSLNSYFENGSRYVWFRDGIVYYRDADHLSFEGALAVAPKLIETSKLQ